MTSHPAKHRLATYRPIHNCTAITAAVLSTFVALPVLFIATPLLSGASASVRTSIQNAPKNTVSKSTVIKTPASKTAKTKTAATAKSPTGGLQLTIAMSEFLKSNVVISVPTGTKAKKITDSTTTVLTFPDGAQMSIQPDAATFSDFKKSILSTEELLKTPAKDKTIFLVEKADRLIYSDNSGANLSKRTVFVMQKKLPSIEINKALATGVLCSNTGQQEEALAPNQASLDAMMAACDSIMAGK